MTTLDLQIIEAVCERNGVTYNELASSSRIQRIVKAREEAVFSLIEWPKHSMKETARLLGRVNHSTVHACYLRVNLRGYRECVELLRDIERRVKAKIARAA